MKTKACTKCGVEKPYDAFAVHTQNPTGRHPRCRECRSVDRKEWYWGNVEEIRATRRAAYDRVALREQRLKRTYGITGADFEKMRQRQYNSCAICFRSEPAHVSGDWVVDHDHADGRVRGLLCARCNLGIGYFLDDPALLGSAIRYLNRERQTNRWLHDAGFGSRQVAEDSTQDAQHEVAQAEEDSGHQGEVEDASDGTEEPIDDLHRSRSRQGLHVQQDRG